MVLDEIEGQRRNILETRLSVDQMAMDFLSVDVIGTESLFPVIVKADGDCFPSSGSVFAFGCIDRVNEICVRIIVELALNEHLYLNSKYLKQGKLSRDRQAKCVSTKGYIKCILYVL